MTSAQSTSFPVILDNAFSASIANTEYTVLQNLKSLYPKDRFHHIPLLDSTNCSSFPLSSFLKAKDVKVEILDDPRHELVSWSARVDTIDPIHLVVDPFNEGARTERGELVPRLLSGTIKFNYGGTEFLVFKSSWYRERMSVSLFDVVFEIKGLSSEDLNSVKTPGHLLITDVFRWAGALKDEMWVFQGGGWSKDKALWASICKSSWDDIVLEDEFLQNLRKDTSTFFENRGIYKDLNVVWKRGILLLGPPGNGKTESIKVLLKETKQPALYVKSFTTHNGPEHGVRQIFDHARANAPCILVIEDLDSLVTPEVRSFFLNELDGIAQNEGILTIATTNHPERIDDAILNRPSRFDVKYDFALPAKELRKEYSRRWIQKIHNLDSAKSHALEFTKPEEELAEELSKVTEGWSFAFLKELFVSFLLRIAHDKARGVVKPATTSFDEILLSQVEMLSNQIKFFDDKTEGAGKSGTTPRFIGAARHFNALAMASSNAGSFF